MRFAEHCYCGSNAIFNFFMCYLKSAIVVLTLKVDSLVSYCKGPHECKWIRLQVLRFVVNASVLGYKLGINSNARERGSTCVLVYFRLRVAAVCLRGISMLLRMKTA